MAVDGTFFETQSLYLLCLLFLKTTSFTSRKQLTDCHKNEKSSLVLSDHLKPSNFVCNVGDIHHMRLRRELTEEPSKSGSAAAALEPSTV